LRRNFGLSYLHEGKLETGYAEFENAFNVAKREKWFDYMSMIIQNLGKILVYQGRYEEAVAAFERAEKISWDRANKNFNPYPIFSYFHTGLAHVKKGDYDSAYIFSEKIKGYIQEQDLDAAYLDYSYLLKGYICAARSDGTGTLDALDRCVGFVKTGPEYNDLSAISSVLLNQYDQAIDKYSKFKTNIYMLRYGNDAYFFFRCASLTDYNLGKIYELKGETAKAIERYEKFLDLWKDADPGIAEVDDARERLAGLK
jgi:tetratricopeptide (TPR) repeat protein